MQPYFNPTRSNMEDDLNLFEKWKTPQVFQKWKTTSIFREMEDDLNFSGNGRQTQFFLEMEDNLKIVWKWNTTSIYVVNGRQLI